MVYKLKSVESLKIVYYGETDKATYELWFHYEQEKAIEGFPERLTYEGLVNIFGEPFARLHLPKDENKGV